MTLHVGDKLGYAISQVQSQPGCSKHKTGPQGLLRECKVILCSRTILRKQPWPGSRLKLQDCKPCELPGRSDMVRMNKFCSACVRVSLEIRFSMSVLRYSVSGWSG